MIRLNRSGTTSEKSYGSTGQSRIRGEKEESERERERERERRREIERVGDVPRDVFVANAHER